MKRISSLLVASALAILPISAFAQQTAAPAKTAEPTGITATAPAPTAPESSKTVAGKTAADKTATPMNQSAKSDVNSRTQGSKTEMHGMNTVAAPHHAKANGPVKAAEPAKS